MRYFVSFALMSFVFLAFCLSHGSAEKFYYFAYGSNLLPTRMHLNNPFAEFYDIAVLQGYRLDFNLYLDMWNGAVATICDDPESNVVGVLWTLDVADMKNLDRQEGVDRGWYYPRNVTVITPDDQRIVARTYIETNNPVKLLPGQPLPPSRQPSITYLKVIIIGAIESGLPNYYIGYLGTNFQTNAYLAPWHIRAELGWPFTY